MDARTEKEQIKIMLDIFGFKKSTRERLRTKGLFAFDQLIRTGFSGKIATRVKKIIGLSDQQIAGFLGVTPVTIRRRLKSRKRFSLIESDRIFRLVYVFSYACQVFEYKPGAQKWLRSPQFGLGDKTPIELIRTEVGAVEAVNLLGRIEYGVLS